MIFIHGGIYKICDAGSGANIQIHLCQSGLGTLPNYFHYHKAAGHDRQKLADFHLSRSYIYSRFYGLLRINTRFLEPG